jgi:uncharacterized membrane protein YhaH (DUF805 family)
MGFGEAITAGFQNYVNFSGRSQRSAFWWWALFTAILAIVAAAVDGMLETVIVYPIVVLGFLLPNLAVQIRRLHDTDRSGWFILLSFIPLVGAIILLVWYCQKGTEGANRFGADPLAA